MKFGTPNVAQMYKNKTDALVDLNINNETYRERQLEGLTKGYEKYAPFQEKEFDINKMQPYNYALQQSMYLKDASIQNKYNALDQGGAAVITGMQGIGAGFKNSLLELMDDPKYAEWLKNLTPDQLAQLKNISE